MPWLKNKFTTKYLTIFEFNQERMSAKKAVLLMNLGSPDSTEVKDVKKYLNEFLMDGRVIDYPYLFRKLLVQGIIVPFRSPKSAEAYKTIWTEQGSPLVVLTKQLQASLQEKISAPVEIAMRYGNPSPEQAFDKILERDSEIEEVIAIPLYPHYAMSSFETAPSKNGFLLTWNSKLKKTKDTTHQQIHPTTQDHSCSKEAIQNI